MTRISPNIFIALVALLGFGFYILFTSNVTIPAGGWLIASILGAAGILVGGEILIKKQGLTDIGAKATRFAFTFAAIAVGYIGVSQVWSGTFPALTFPQMSLLTAGVIFGGLTLLVMYLAGVYGFYQKGAPVFTKGTTVVVTVAVLALLLVYILIGPSRTAQLGGAMQGVAQTQFDAWMAGQPIIIPNIDWGYVALGFFGLAFLAGLWKMKVIQAATMLTGAAIWLPFIAWMAWGSLPADFKADVSGALGAANETVNPWLGETRYANLTTTQDLRLVVNDIGPHDTVRVHIPPKFCTVDWEATPFWLQQYGNATWYDPTGHYLYKVSGGSSLTRTYAFTDAFKEGLKAAGANVALEFRANCQQP